MKEKTLGTLIMGVGFVGKRLKKKLEERGENVFGLSRSLSKEEENFYSVNLEESVLSLPCLLNSNALVISLPPKKNLHENFLDYLEKEKPMNLRKIILWSSIGIYRKEKKEQMEEIEDLWRKNSLEVDLFILRLGGLVDKEGRHPGRFLSGRKNIPGGDDPVNLVHVSDVVDLTSLLIKEKEIDEIEKRVHVYDVVSEDHPLKKEFYHKAALQLHLPPGEFLSTSEGSKVIKSDEVKKDFCFSFKNLDEFIV